MEVLESRIAPAAVTIFVTSLADKDQAGKITLRDAITTANNSGLPTIINFGTATKAMKGTITLGSPLAINDDITINGAGITLSGANKTGVLQITGGTTIDLNGLTITKGNAIHGAGVYIDDQNGTITISNATITGNHATNPNTNGGNGYSAAGGGIFNYTGTLVVQGSTISGNSVTGGTGAKGGYAGGSAAGGGIFNEASLSITNSKITGNTVTGGKGSAGLNGKYAKIATSAGGNGGGAYGGGIATAGSSDLTVTSSLISGNVIKGGAGANGGKGYNGPNGYNAKVSSHSVSGAGPGINGGGGYAGGNGGNAFGGGIGSYNGYNTVSVTGSFISGNTATPGAAGNAAAGGKGGNGGNDIVFGGKTYQGYAGGSGGPGGNAGTPGVAKGGGIYSGYSLSVITSTISGNTLGMVKNTTAGAGGAVGKTGSHYVSKGAAPAAGAAGTPINAALNFSSGGGIYSGAYAGSASSLTISLDTIAKNTADMGGGVSVFQNATASIHNSTIALNTATAAGGGLFVTLDSANDIPDAVSNIIAQNTAKSLVNVDGTTTDIDNLLSAGSVGTKLALHDGNTLTPTLLPLASIIPVANNATNNPDGLTTDQNAQNFGVNTMLPGAVQTLT